MRAVRRPGGGRPHAGGAAMSTSYYRLRSPVTSVQLDEGPGHDRLRVYVNGVYVGELTLALGEGCEVARLLAESDPTMHVSYGGDARGCVVQELRANLHDWDTLIDESGKVATVRDVRAFAGQGKREEEERA